MLKIENIEFACETDVTLEEFISLLQRSTLAARRPMDRPDILEAMVRRADLMVTARKDHQLIGISRALTDYAFCTYLSDLAVDVAYQRQGIGRELIRRTHDAAGLQTKLVLLAAPQATEYYPHIGFQRHESCWVRWPSDEPPKVAGASC